MLIEIYPPRLIYNKENAQKIIEIEPAITNSTTSKEIFDFLLAKDASLLQSEKDILSACDKLISASTINPNKQYHLEKTFHCHDQPLTKCIFDSSGDKFLTSSYDETSILWNRNTGEVIHILKGHTDVVNSISFSNTNVGKLFTASFDKTAKIWDEKTGKCEATLQGHNDEVVDMNVSKNDKLIATGSMDFSVKLWSIEAAKEIISINQHKAEIIKVLFNNDATRVLSGSYDQTVKLFDTKTGKIIVDLVGHSGDISSFEYADDENIIVSTSLDQTCKVWDIRKGDKCLKTFKEEGEVFGLALKDSLCATCNSAGAISVYDIDKLTISKELKGHNREVFKVCFNSDGKFLISGSGDGNCKLWKVETGENVEDLEGTGGEMFNCAFSKDDTSIITGSLDNICKIWTNTIKIK